VPLSKVERKTGFTRIKPMAAHIPFVNTPRDCKILSKYYKDSHIIRVSLESISKIRTQLPSNMPLWIDPAIDGYHHRLITKWPEDRREWNKTLSQLWKSLEDVFNKFDGYEILSDKKHWIKGELPRLETFVNQVLDKCYSFNPTWISIPQLPLVNDGGRNKINEWLAQATAKWKKQNQRGIKLILPVIFTSTIQLTKKQMRDNKFESIKNCYEIANADGIWMADTNLSDQNRNDQYPNRYAKLIEFHDNIKESLPKAIKITGPYWGLNLVLWARGLCDYPAVSLGSPYVYYISCGTARPGSIRLAIPPIKRWVVASKELHTWLEKVLTQIGPEDSARKELSDLVQNFNVYRQRDHAIDQVAKFYKKWFDEIEPIPDKGRALALFQNLSSAYVLGKQLPDLPTTALPYCSGKMLEAGKAAEQLMLKCL